MKRQVSPQVGVLSVVGGAVAAVGLGALLVPALVGSEIALGALSVGVATLAGTFSGAIARIAKRTKSPRRVFISYAYSDAAVAHEVSSTLEANGARVWLASERLKPGDKIEPVITRALADADVVVALLSATTSAWRSLEIGTALAAGTRIIPLLLADAEIPDELADVTPVDMTGDREAGLGELVKALT